jgi:hypothetical protein
MHDARHHRRAPVRRRRTRHPRAGCRVRLHPLHHGRASVPVRLRRRGRHPDQTHRMAPRLQRRRHSRWTPRSATGPSPAAPTTGSPTAASAGTDSGDPPKLHSPAPAKTHTGNGTSTTAHRSRSAQIRRPATSESRPVRRDDCRHGFALTSGCAVGVSAAEPGEIEQLDKCRTYAVGDERDASLRWHHGNICTTRPGELAAFLQLWCPRNPGIQGVSRHHKCKINAGGDLPAHPAWLNGSGFSPGRARWM